MASFLSQFYDQAKVAPEGWCQWSRPAPTFAEWLSDKRKAQAGHEEDVSVRVLLPAGDEAITVMMMAESNAAKSLRTLRADREADKSKQVLAVQELQVALGLEAPPGRIECFDISTLQGTNTVGSMVVFAEGTPRKSDYRGYKFAVAVRKASRTISPRCEMLRRRFRRAVEPNKRIRAPRLAAAPLSGPFCPT